MNRNGLASKHPALGLLIDRSETLEYFAVDRDGCVTEANRAFATHVNASGDVIGDDIRRYLVAADQAMVSEWMDDGGPAELALLNFVDTRNLPYTLKCAVAVTPLASVPHDARAAGGRAARSGVSERLEILGERDAVGQDHLSQRMLSMNNELATLGREHARRGRQLEAANAKLLQALGDLEKSHWHLRKVQEIMPVCMGCSKLKTHGHEWQSVSRYFAENDIFLSHGYCPDCAAAVLAEIESRG